jgi:DnaK suppressor protein
MVSRTGFKGLAPRARRRDDVSRISQETHMPPTPAPLTAAQRDALKAKLVSRRTALRADIKAKLNAQDDPSLMGLRHRMEDIDDWAVADLETALDVAEVSRDAAELHDVDAALTRIDTEIYGTCLECGAPIPYARLEVYPMAARCIACQEQLEAAMRRAGAGTF